jgi:hypothetical protein
MLQLACKPIRCGCGSANPGVGVFQDVLNNGTAGNQVLRPLGAVHAFFRRLRITMRGVVIEDIMDYNRVHEMFDILFTPQARANVKAEEFGYNIALREIANPNDIPGIRRQLTACFKPLAGILMQAKYVPLRYCPLEIELELADSDDPVISSIFNTTRHWNH